MTDEGQASLQQSQSSDMVAVLHDAVTKAGGPGIYADAVKTREMINGLPSQAAPTAVKDRFNMVLSATGIGAMLANADDGISMVQFDAAVHSVVANSGLTYSSAIGTLHDLLASCGVADIPEDGVATDKDGAFVHVNRCLTDDDEETQAADIVSKLNWIRGQEEARKSKSPEFDADRYRNSCGTTAGAIRRLMQAGSSAGFYFAGVCYRLGSCGFAQDDKEAVRHLTIAAEGGYIEAAALLGDIYYQSDGTSGVTKDYDKAYYFYTRPGAMPLTNQERVSAVKDMRLQYWQNPVLLGFAVALLVLQIIFLAVFHTSPISGSSCMIPGVVCTVISAVLVAYSVYQHRRLPFRGWRFVIPLEFFIWMIFVVFLVLM